MGFLNKIFGKSRETAAETEVQQDVSSSFAGEIESPTLISDLEKDYESRLLAIEEKYKKLLDESQEQINDLNGKLSSALDGHLDDTMKESLALVDSLKKKIKVLEDDVEEANDDLEDVKKRLKKKVEENDELREKISEHESATRKLNDSVSELKQELEQKTKELEINIDALSFVQEILGAKEATDDHTRDLYSHVSEVDNFVRGDLRDCFKEIWDMDPEYERYYFAQGLTNWATKAKKSWVFGKTSIAFVGEFSAGKTSIVNRILSQDNPDVPTLPVSTKATTAIPTYISGYPSSTFQFVSPDNSLKTISESTFRKVNKEVLEQIKGVSSLIKYFVMGYNNPNLENLSILDTPGFNSNDPEDATRTIEVINECDALFWVFDVNAGTVNRSSIELIKDNLTKPLYIVINKVDTKTTSEVDKVEQLIEKTLSDAEISYEGIIRFSQKSSISDIMTPILGVKRDEAQDNYLFELEEFVNSSANDLQNIVKKEKKDKDKYAKKLDSIYSKYTSALQKLQDDCVDASEIPRYKSGFLGIGEGYKMSMEEYNQLITTLDSICNNRVQSLIEHFNNMQDVISEYNDSEESHERHRRQWQLVNEIRKRLNKLTNYWR